MSEKKRYIDLHLHTSMSDGAQTLDEVIRAARNEGLDAIAITDHNYFAIDSPSRAGNLEVIPGCEFSTDYHTKAGRKVEIHIVGLFFHGIDRRLNDIFSGVDKDDYVKAILKKLGTLGIAISLEELRRKFPDAHQLGRTQIADLLVEKGYGSDRDNAMDLWIGNYSKHYLNPVDYTSYIKMDECVKRIAESGGLHVLAHPYHYRFSDGEIEQLVKTFRDSTDRPLGMEVYYQKYDEEKVGFLKALADSYHLLPSAGSDRHKADAPFAKGEYSLLEDMKRCYQERN